jgi:hypothetical protein
VRVGCGKEGECGCEGVEGVDRGWEGGHFFTSSLVESAIDL